MAMASAALFGASTPLAKLVLGGGLDASQRASLRVLFARAVQSGGEMRRA